MIEREVCWWQRTMRGVGVMLPLLCGRWAATAWAAGYEKVAPWSGRYGGLAGAATASVSGAEALFFNPAGLAARPGGEVALDFSPTFAKPQGQLPSPSPTLHLSAAGGRAFIPSGGALASYRLSRRCGIGVGYYAAGGIRAEYSSVDYRPLFPSAMLRPTIRAKLFISEVALGAAYELAPGLRLGAAWRVVNAAGDFSTVRILGPTSFTNIHFRDLRDTRFTGAKVGIQYQAPDGGWGVGAVWRSGVGFRAEDTATGQVDAAGVVTTLPPGTASIANTFPQQFTLGGSYAASDRVRLFAEYAWTEYSQDRALDISGNLGPLSLATVARVEQHWRDMHIVRLGVERSGVGAWTLRAGYAYTSRVIPHDFARATFIAPGPGHTFTLGAGSALGPRVRLDAALEYAFASGVGSNPADNVSTGSFRSDSVALHTGVSYTF